MSPYYPVAILALLFPLLTVAVDISGDSTAIGAWTPLKNIRDPHVIEIAKFAVNAYSRQNNKYLIFLNVIKGSNQNIESGILYQLVIRVKVLRDVHNHTADYQAIVLSKAPLGPWMTAPKKLISFSQISN